MKKNFKKLFLLLAVVVTAVVCFAFSASALDATGQCGDNVYWEYNSTTGELVISGTGPMTDYEKYNGSPFYKSNIQSAVINDGVTTIGDKAFYNCDSLKKVTIGDSVTTIGDWVFCSCDSLTEVTIPDSVTTIGDNAFYSCDSLTEVTIGDSVTTIGDYAFCECYSLTEVTIPDSVTTIGDKAFYNCDSLKKVTIGDSVTTIGDEAFYNCDSLKKVTIGDSVTTIGVGAFYSCNSLAEVTIPDSVTTIGDCAFEYCGSLTEVTIPDRVTTIGDCAFRSCYSLTKVTIGDSVTTIGFSAFDHCDSLTEVTIPDSVTTIGYFAFNCKSLTDVYYGGTQEQWKKIKIGSYNSGLTGANIHYNKSGKPIESTYSEEFNGAVSKYPDFKKLMSSYCALPGLKSTVVTDADQNVCYTCNCMTPQGICFAGDYVLVSAYCSIETYKDNLNAKVLNGANSDKLSAEKNHSAHKSVIYVIDRNKKTLLTTLTLPDKNHVGGLAFDGSNVWIAKSSDKKVSAISLSTIKSAVNSGDEGVAVNYKKTFSCGRTASFVEYFDNKLWVGVFNEEKSSYMYGFTFNGGKENVNGLTEVASVAIPAKANGAAFYSNGTKTALIVNSSYGRKNDSKIYLYDVKSALNQKNITTNLMTTYTFPTLAEEVVVEGDKVYMIFESAATTYCNVDGNKASSVVDRICEGNAADFFSWTKDYEKVASTTYKGVTATIDSAYFENDSINYNHNLGRFCSLFTVIGYEYDRPDIIKMNLENCGFVVNSDYIVTDAGRDQVNNFITHKRIYANGKWQNLVFAAFIGSHEQQWYSNFDPEIGSTHLGFTNAMNYVLPKIRKYIQDNGFEKDSTKILLTGHSRGAATCNLVAAQLISSEEFATKENIYAYAFATPNITKANYAKQEKYDRIFNIVNPEDFVTKILPEEWGFGKFGSSIYTLPSSTNTTSSTYKTQLNNMQQYYKKLTSEVFTPYPDGEFTVRRLVNSFVSNISGLNDYYNKNIKTSVINSLTPYSFFQWVLCPFVAHDYEKVLISVTHIVNILGNSASDCVYRDVINFFITNEATYMICNGMGIKEEELGKTINPNFSANHRPEAYCAYMYSLSSSELTKTRISRPMSINPGQNTTEILLNWSKVPNADCYRVYRKHASGWTKLAETQNCNAIITNLKAGTKYSFAVKAGKKADGKITWSDVYTTIATATKAVKVSKITATQTTSTIKLTWNKVAGATGYRVYQKVDGKWKTLKSSTTATSYTVKNLKAGTKYTFAVKPYIKTDSGNVWSAYTQFTTATKPANPTAKVTAPSKGKLTVNWKAVSGAESYQLYYKTGNGSYKLYKTYTGAKTLNFSNLKSGTKYTFAVRAVIKTDGGNVRSGYKAVSVTVK